MEGRGLISQIPNSTDDEIKTIDDEIKLLTEETETVNEKIKEMVDEENPGDSLSSLEQLKIQLDLLNTKKSTIELSNYWKVILIFGSFALAAIFTKIIADKISTTINDKMEDFRNDWDHNIRYYPTVNETCEETFNRTLDTWSENGRGESCQYPNAFCGDITTAYCAETTKLIIADSVAEVASGSGVIVTFIALCLFIRNIYNKLYQPIGEVVSDNEFNQLKLACSNLDIYINKKTTVRSLINKLEQKQAALNGETNSSRQRGILDFFKMFIKASPSEPSIKPAFTQGPR